MKKSIRTAKPRVLNKVIQTTRYSVVMPDSPGAATRVFANNTELEGILEMLWNSDERILTLKIHLDEERLFVMGAGR